MVIPVKTQLTLEGQVSVGSGGNIKKNKNDAPFLEITPE